MLRPNYGAYSKVQGTEIIVELFKVFLFLVVIKDWSWAVGVSSCRVWGLEAEAA